MIIPVSGNLTPNYLYKTPVKKNQINNSNISKSQEIKKVAPINISNIGNTTRISFKGNFVDPSSPSIQFKVRGVSNHQKDYGSDTYTRDRNVENLANSDWYDGKKLNFEIISTRDAERILIKDPQHGELGRVPDEVAPSLLKMLKRYPNDYVFQLSNVLAGTTKGAPTIGLRANLIYTGTDEKVKKKTEEIFNGLLNSPKKDIRDVIMLYQPKTTPKEVLQKIFANVDESQGEEAAFRVLDIVDTISSEITDPRNKNILLLGHTAPDGDTIGCVLGLHAAIKANYPGKNVVCSIDDKIPGIYRDKLPGIRNITHPSDPDTVENLRAELAELKAKPQSFITRTQIRTIEKELAALDKNMTVFSKYASKDEVPSEYDLVILMDVPSPSKFTGSYKKEIENAGKVIYIDHHRERFEEWDAQQARTGINMSQVRDNNLALVLPELPATTEMVTVIADHAGLLEKTMQNKETAKQFVAAIVSGTSSDTGGFARTANYKPTDMSKPVQERPNYLPEGLSKWLIEKLGNIVDKKWLRENIVYDLPDKKVAGMSVSAREKLIDYSLDSQAIYEENGFGVIALDYDKMYDVWDVARMFDRKVTFGDVQNSAKYSEVMSALREAPSIKTKNSEIEPYESRYQDDKISLLMIQDKKAGRPTESGEIADTNSIRMSFRSQEGTVYAEQLASLFGGGGHGSAAGGRITLPDVELTSPIAIKIDGEVEYNPKKIYKAMSENFEIKNAQEMNPDIDLSQMHKFEPVIDEKGLPVNDLVNNIVGVIREEAKEQLRKSFKF